MIEEKDEEGISLGEMFSIIWRKKILLGIVCIASAIIFGLITMLAIDPTKEIYYATFEYNFPGIDNSKYPDGKLFDYRNIISYNQLKTIQDSKSNYSNIDVNNMYNKNNISIAPIARKVNNEELTVVGGYTLSAKAKYFKNEKQALEFFENMIMTPYNTALEKINHLSYGDYLDSSKTAGQYETQINLLLSQKSLLQGGYSNLITTYGDIKIGDKKISEHKIELDRFFSDNNIDFLMQELNSNGYVKDFANYESQLNLSKDRLNIEYEDNNKIIANLNKQIEILLGLASSSSVIQTFESYNAIIAQKMSRNVEIERELIIIDEKLLGKNLDTTNFDTRLEFYTNNLDKYTAAYTNVVKFIYEQYSKISFHSNSIIEADGGIGTILGAIIGAVAAGLIGCVVVVVVDLSKVKKNPKDDTLLLKQ